MQLHNRQHALVPYLKERSVIRLFLAALVTLLASTTLWAQDYVDLANFTGAYGAPSAFEDGSGAQTPVREWQGNLLLPIRFGDKLALLPAIAGDITTLRLAPGADFRQFNQLNPRMGLRIRHSEHWSGTYYWLPKRMWQQGAHDDGVWQMGGLVLYNYQPPEKQIKYKMGLYYNQELFGPFFVPLFGLYAQKNRWEYNLTLPLAANVNYRINDQWRGGFDFFAIVRTYPISEGNFQSHYLTKGTIEPKLFVRYEPVRGVLIRLLAGYTIGRDYEIFERGEQVAWGLSAFEFGDDRSLQNIPFEDGFTLQLNLRYRFYLGDKQKGAGNPKG